MSGEKINKEAMYRVLKSLWFTKETVNFVALNEGVILVKFGNINDRTRILNLTLWLFDQFLFVMLPFVKGQEMDDYAFNFTPFWIRIYNILFEPFRQVVHLVGNEGTETVCAIKIEILENKINSNEENNGNKVGNEVKNNITILKGKEKVRVGEDYSESCSHMEKCPIRSARDRGGEMKCKRKRTKGSNRENNEESPNRIVQRKLIGRISPCKTVVDDQPRQEMPGCLAMNSKGQHRGLVLMWKEGVDVAIQNYSSHHINSLVKIEGHNKFRFIGFYGHADPNLRNRS
ncbi:hypothetical protein Gohar_010950 [Gossypium harknessii]|uniref:DUF4283 domain-containing protein n=1 Tax=Gossypium harknessii TaxID=34285 RepID=A0A7J9GTV8_9ROSI|nr:hypothetical protein [Gossypium harknessii]